MVEDYAGLLQEGNLEPITSSLVVKNSADLLLEISGELQSVSGEMQSISKRVQAANEFKRLAKSEVSRPGKFSRWYVPLGI